MLEAELQKALHDLVAQNQLKDVVEGVEDVRQALASAHDPDALPPFPVDYHHRKRALEAAAGVIDQLHDLSLIAYIGPCEHPSRRRVITRLGM